VTEPWAHEATVLDLSDTDLEASRSVNTGVSDPERNLHRLVGTIAVRESLTVSEAIDRSLRVALASVLDHASADADAVSSSWQGQESDSHTVPFTRDTFDVAYSIPPNGWLTRQRFTRQELVDDADLPEPIQLEKPNLIYSTSPVVHEMAKRTVDAGATETISALVIAGARILLGRD